LRGRWRLPWALALAVTGAVSACGDSDPAPPAPGAPGAPGAEVAPPASPPPVADEELVGVLVAAEAIPKGTPVARVKAGAMVAPTQVPGNLRPATAVTGVPDLGADTRVARDDIAPGAIIEAGMFAPP
jgi:hypothetical protein